MKKTILISSVLLLASCVQPHPAYNPNQQAASGRGAYYVAPGQEPVRVRPTDTDAAFDQQVAAYQNGGATQQVPVQPVPGNGAYATQPYMEQTLPTQQPGPVVITQPQQPDSVVITQPQQTADIYAQQDAAAMGGVVAPGVPAQVNPAATGSVNYNIRVTNSTNGRIYVEAHDAAGEIYPLGFMAGQDIAISKKGQVAPIHGPITVVVRDPDQPGAPELRRYKVEPPANYQGKTIGITIVSGGRYEVSLNGQHCYSSPEPAGSSPAPAPAPAATPAPAPMPAGI